MDGGTFAEYVSTLQVLQVKGFVNAASITLWVYDYAGTFSLEVTLIWRAPWNFPKVLFILTRYLPMAAFGVLLYYDKAHLSAGECQTCQKVVIWIFNISICIAEMIFTIRTWAVWGRNCKMGVFLAIFSLAIWASHFTLVALLLPSIQAIIVESFRPIIILGCDFLTTGLMISRNYILIAVFYIVTLPLTLWRAYQYLIASQGNTSLVKVFFFHGVVYYVVLFSASLAILVIDFAAAYASTLSRIQHVLCTVLASRMPLHLRAQAAALRSRDTSSLKSSVDLDSLVFRHPDLDAVDFVSDRRDFKDHNTVVLAKQSENV